MNNDLFSIGNVTIHGYGLMIAIGILAAYALTAYRTPKKGLDMDHVFGIAIGAIIGGFACAKILYFITIYKEIIDDPKLLLNLTDGFVVYGGIVGGIVVSYLYCRFHKLRFIEYSDLILPAVALAQGFGRIGCFLAGCCYGKVTDSAMHITFTHSHFAPNNVPLVPTQLISSGLDFLNCIVLIVIARFAKKKGQVTAFYLIFYSIGRFVIEFFRGDLERGSVGNLSTSQFISIFILAAGVAFLAYCTASKDKKDETEQQ